MLREIVARIVLVAEPECIFLFGSAARGEMGRNSDVDLLVIKRGPFDYAQLAGDIYVHLHGVGQAVDVVLVTPEQAEILNLASGETRIQLVLRNPLDTQQVKTTGTATANLYSGLPFREAKSEAAPKPRMIVRTVAAPPMPVKETVTVPITVEVIHGTTRVQSKFKNTSEEKGDVK